MSRGKRSENLHGQSPPFDVVRKGFKYGVRHKETGLVFHLYDERRDAEHKAIELNNVSDSQ